MRFKIELDIDYIDEESSLDYKIEQQIVKEITNKVQQQVFHKMESIIYNRVKNLIDNWIREQLIAFSEKPIRLTDKWGDTTEHHASLNDMLKAQLDDFLTKNVDKDGRAINGCSYGQKKNRVDYLIDKKVDDAFKQMSKSMDNLITSKVSKNTKALLEEKIIKHVTEQTSKLLLKD